MVRQIYSITQINEHIRSLIDGDVLLSNVVVRGEISNYKVYPSGHHYFTLKDENAALRCVMFRSSAIKLKFRPDNGMKVIAIGKVNVYPRDGAYQLYCTAMTADGVGDLHAAFEELKAKLAKEGLFDPVHKQPIPKYPGVIGIVTSSAGAAIHDMLRILRKRYPLTTVRLLPVRVQGTEAPGEIAAAIAYANRHRLADLLIVGRGGGSLEDLWAFNDETVARAIFASKIPVISAVGHEPDVTISDYVADLRAATPSNAAELAVPDADVLRQTLDNISSSMVSGLRRQIKTERSRLNVLRSSAVLMKPEGYIILRRQSYMLLKNRLVSAEDNLVNRYKKRFLYTTAKLDALSPLKVLTRGYATVSNADGVLVRSVKEIKSGDRISLQVSDGTVEAKVTEIKEEFQ